MSLQQKILIRLNWLQEVINADSFPVAEKILPSSISCFDDLWARTLDIEELRLLPVKTDEDRKSYHSLNRIAISDAIGDRLIIDSIFVEDNKYPYFLPPDVHQQIIWVAERMSNEDLSIFIEDHILNQKLDWKKLILFERPRFTKQALVRGTIPQIRHLHLWSKQ